MNILQKIMILSCLGTTHLYAGITVVGIGKANIAPNIVSFSASIETKAATANEAAQNNAKQTEKTIKLLKTLITTAKAVTTSGYSVYPDYQYDRTSGESKFVGFVVNNSINVKTNELDSIGSILDKTIDSGITRINNLSFSYDKPEKIYQSALEDAVENAKQRANSLAKASGLSTSKISDIKVISYQYTPPVRPMMAKMAIAESTPTTPIESPDVESEAIIEVVFEG